jgi:trehalose/maltose transport system substrate-binding protein
VSDVKDLPVSILVSTFLSAYTCGCNTPRNVTVTLMGLGLDAGRQLQENSLPAFTRQTGVQVDLIPVLGSSAEQLDQMLRLLNQRASAPDVYVIDVVFPGVLGEHLLDLSPYQDAESSSHLQELLKNDTVQGRLVSLPFYLNVGMLYYRTDLLQKYGYSNPPGTWAELESMAARIQKGERAAGNQDFWGYVWQGAEYEGLTCNALEWQVSFGGGRLIEPDGTITVRNVRTADALKAAARWRNTISPPSVLSYTEGDSLNAFSSGKAAFLRHWSGGFSRARASESSIADRFAMAPLPAGTHGRAQTMGGFQLSVSRYSKHPREAAELVLYLTGKEVQLNRALSSGYLPTIPALYQNPELVRLLPFVEELRKGASSWIARPSSISKSKYRDVSKAYYTTVHNVLTGEADADSALAALERRLIELTGFRTGSPAP